VQAFVPPRGQLSNRSSNRNPKSQRLELATSTLARLRRAAKSAGMTLIT
jgi:hypothetical protein